MLFDYFFLYLCIDGVHNPDTWGLAKLVRHQVLILKFTGSIPVSPEKIRLVVDR